MKAPLRTSTVSTEMVIDGDLPGPLLMVCICGWLPLAVAGCPTKRKEPAWIVILGTSAATIELFAPNGPTNWIPGGTKLNGPPMVTPLATRILTSPLPTGGAGAPFEVAVGATEVKNPGKIAALVIARSPPLMNTFL